MPRIELIKGTLNMLILRCLELEARHAMAIADRIERVTHGTFQVRPGSLFPALQRLERDGFVEGTWSSSRARRVRSYALTASGRMQLDRELAQWARLVLAVTQALGDEN